MPQYLSDIFYDTLYYFIDHKKVSVIVLCLLSGSAWGSYTYIPEILESYGKKTEITQKNENNDILKETENGDDEEDTTLEIPGDEEEETQGVSETSLPQESLPVSDKNKAEKKTGFFQKITGIFGFGEKKQELTQTQEIHSEKNETPEESGDIFPKIENEFEISGSGISPEGTKEDLATKTQDIAKVENKKTIKEQVLASVRNKKTNPVIPNTVINPIFPTTNTGTVTTTTTTPTPVTPTPTPVVHTPTTTNTGTVTTTTTTPTPVTPIPTPVVPTPTTTNTGTVTTTTTTPTPLTPTPTPVTPTPTPVTPTPTPVTPTPTPVVPTPTTTNTGTVTTTTTTPTPVTPIPTPVVPTPTTTTGETTTPGNTGLDGNPVETVVDEYFENDGFFNTSQGSLVPIKVVAVHARSPIPPVPGTCPAGYSFLGYNSNIYNNTTLLLPYVQNGNNLTLTNEYIVKDDIGYYFKIFNVNGVKIGGVIYKIGNPGVNFHWTFTVCTEN